MAIERIGGISPLEPPVTPSKSAGPTGGFAQTLDNLVESVNESTGEANAAVGRMLNGTGDVQDRKSVV